MPYVTVKHQFIHQAPRKLRLVSNAVRGLPAKRAVEELMLTSQVAAFPIRKLILSGIAAAKEQGLDSNTLFISSIAVNEGPKLRRFIPRSKGSSSPILKRMSHITLQLTNEAITMSNSKAYKRELRINATKQTNSKEMATGSEPKITSERPITTGDTSQKTQSAGTKGSK